MSGHSLQQGVRRIESKGAVILASPLANDRWLVQAFANHYHIETFNYKSHAFQWIEAFLMFL